jgi:nicotinic acid mononucleotide adenylyltransferase
MSTKTIIFTISRMNPPTPGHMEVVKELFHQAIRLHETTAYIILSKKRDTKNPIPCSVTDASETDKITVLEHLIEGLRERIISLEPDQDTKKLIKAIRIVTMCVQPTEISPFSTLKRLVNDSKQHNLFLVIGEDRADMVDSIRKVLNKDTDAKILKRTGMDSLKSLGKNDYATLDVDTIKPSEISGSFVRNLVLYKQLDKFKQLYIRFAPSMPEDLIQRLYRTIQDGMAASDVVKKPKSATKKRSRSASSSKTPSKKTSSNTFQKKKSRTAKSPK